VVWKNYIFIDRENVREEEFDRIGSKAIIGTADGEARHGLGRALELAAGGMVKKILVHEVSRLARRNSIAHVFDEKLEAHGVSLYWHQQGIETLLENGKRTRSAATAFSFRNCFAALKANSLIFRSPGQIGATPASHFRSFREISHGR
jgi:DNA invertase Pin-like site-specific DNA recombinase